jgi:hypothetical protein
MSFKQRLRRLRAKAEDGAVVVHQRDGSLRRFEVMHVYAEMFMAGMDLLRDGARESDVLEAVRGATPESRAAFEERFGPIRKVTHIITPEDRGGQVEQKVLTEDGRVERVLYEGGSEEAERVREGLRSGAFSGQGEELPRPPVAGRWIDETAEDLSG